MRFASPEFLYAIPVALAFIAWASVRNVRRKRALMEKFSGGAGQEWAESGASKTRRRVDLFWFALVVMSLLATLARPMYFARDDRDELQGASYLIALDASRSMLAGDVQPSRYVAATQALDRYFAEGRGEHVGLITFSGVAYLNSPLTFDMTALRTILGYVNPQALVDPGSAIASALDRAGRFFRSNAIPERTLILISDGEDLDGLAVGLARRMHRSEKVTVHTIGVGTTEGAPIPSWRGGVYNQNMTTREIVTRLDESNLRRIANAGGGNYYRLGQNGEGLRRVREEVLRPLAEKAARNDLRNYHQLYFAPLGVAIVALLARLVLGADRAVRRRPLPSAMKATAITLLAVFAVETRAGGVDVSELQQRVESGKADSALQYLNREVMDDPKNPYLLYNRAVAAYAAGKFEQALVDLDMVEDSGHATLAPKAQFQKGNTQFRIGAAALERDPELTLSHWRQSINEYRELLKARPADGNASTNQAIVQKRMMALLMKLGAKNLDAAIKTTNPESKVNTARTAMEEFHEASELEPQNPEAKSGEERAKDLLANALAQEGEKKTMATRLVPPAKNEPAVMRPDTAQIQEGVHMLEDASGLKPDDASIKEKLERGRDKLADALTSQARIYQDIEPRIPRLDEKLGILRMAMELLEKALSERTNHERAKQGLEEVKSRLAQIHEQEGDRLEQRAENASLEQQTQDLSNALDHFQQGSQLQPDQPQLPQKAQRAQSKLEEALEKLGDKLMKGPGKEEALEQQVMRMEGASQAFNELESLKPTPQVSEKAKAAGDALEKLRQMLAEKGSPQQPGGQQPGLAQSPPQDAQDGVPMDAPPRLDKKGKNGAYQSGSMNRSLRDY
jgi:Ca-activated chloride channel family protein